MSSLENILARDLRPWLENDLELPPLTVEYISGLSGLSLSVIIKLIDSEEISLTDTAGNSWQPQLICEIPPEQIKTTIKGTRRNEIGRLVPFQLVKNERIPRGLKDVKELNQSGLNLNPKRLIRQSRYESRAPGGGPVVKAGFQEKRLTGQIVAAVKEKMKVVFINKKDLDI